MQIPTGTRQADYIQQHNIYNELPAPPGSVGSMNEATMQMLMYFPLAIIGVKVLYEISKPVRVDLEKVAVQHPDTKEEVFVFKPTAIHKDYNKGLYGYDLIKAPILEYTRIESIVSEQMSLYNDEMDFWLQHGKDSEKFLEKKFQLFSPIDAITTDAQDIERLRPASLQQQNQ